MHRLLDLCEGAVIAYDRLLIATGSRPIRPQNTHGSYTEGVMALRTLADAMQRVN